MKISNGSKKLIYISISVILKNVKGYKKYSVIYRELAYKLTKNINEKLKNNEMTETQKKKVKPYFDLVNKVKELESKKDRSERDYNNYMLSYLYIIPSFTPRNEYMKINVVYKKDDVNDTDNFILVEDNKISFILQDYKTKKTYNKIIYEYTKNEEVVIRDYLKYLNQPSILFNFNRQKLHKKLDNLLGSSNRFIRISKNTHYLKKDGYNKKSYKEQENFQIKNFQHSKEQSETTYKKNDLQEENKDQTEKEKYWSNKERKYELEQKKVKELKNICKEKNLKKYSTFKKKELVEFILRNE